MKRTKVTSTSRRVLKALSIFGSLQVLLILCSILRNKFVAVWLGAAGVGMFALYNYTLELINQLTQLNIRQSGVREIAGSPDSGAPRIIAGVRRMSRLLAVSGAAVTLLLSPLLSKWTFGDYAHTWGFAVLSFTVGFSAITAGEQAVLQASDRLKQLARAVATGALLGTSVSILLYKTLGMNSIVPSIFVFAAFVAGASLYQSRKAVSSPSISFRDAICDMRPMMRLGLYMTVSMAAASLASYIFLAWLRSRTGEGGVGIYQAGYMIINQYVGLIFMAMGVEYFPRISRVVRSSKRTSIFMAHELLLVMLILLPAVVVFINAVPLIVRILYSREFDAVVPYLTIAGVGTVFKAISFSMAYVILARGDGRTYLVTESISAVLFVLFGITGYLWGGLVGIAYGYVFWYAAYTVSVTIVCRYVYHLTRLGRTLLLSAAVVAAAVMQSALCFHGHYIPAACVSTVCISLSAFFIYRLVLKRKTLKE